MWSRPTDSSERSLVSRNIHLSGTEPLFLFLHPLLCEEREVGFFNVVVIMILYDFSLKVS